MIAITRQRKLDEFTLAYIECAFWSECDESTPSGGEPFDKNYDTTELAPSALDAMVSDCQQFQAENWDMIAIDVRRAGIDFWLTRCGHGAGFWDGDWPEDGDALTEACKRFPAANLYLGDDGLIYHFAG